MLVHEILFTIVSTLKMISEEGPVMYARVLVTDLSTTWVSIFTRIVDEQGYIFTCTAAEQGYNIKVVQFSEGNVGH